MSASANQLKITFMLLQSTSWRWPKTLKMLQSTSWRWTTELDAGSPPAEDDQHTYSDGAAVHRYRGTICIDAAALCRWCCTPPSIEEQQTYCRCCCSTPAEENNNRYRCCLKSISNRTSTDKDADAVHSTSYRRITYKYAAAVHQLYRNNKQSVSPRADLKVINS